MRDSVSRASMRPPEFTGGNRRRGEASERNALRLASMRPPEFTGGNLLPSVTTIQDMIALQ